MDRNGVRAMTVTIPPEPIRGTISMLPSKSQLHRLLIIAALADRETYIRSAPTQAEDVDATIACLSALNADIQRDKNGFKVKPINRSKLPRHVILPCRESGATFRFMLPVVCALGVSAEFHMAGRLPKRPLAPLDRELERHGIKITRPAPDILCADGKLISGEFRLLGNITSQYITGLLMALPLLSEDSILTIEGEVESVDYINMTLEVMERFGYTPGIEENRYKINGGSQYRSMGELYAEGDWSNAAFWLCAGALQGGDMTVRNLSMNSRQGDIEVMNILEKMGAEVVRSADSVRVSERKRKAVEINAVAIPDLIPVLALVAAVSEGETIVRNAARLRIKESDRLASTAATLNTLGANVVEGEDSLRIQGVTRLKGGTVDAWGDHRIAMMAAIAAAASKEAVTITGAQAIRKSYPQFFEELKGVLHVKYLEK